MRQEQVDTTVPHGDVDQVNEQWRNSTFEEVSVNTNLPRPLWTPGGVLGEWDDVWVHQATWLRN